MQEFATHSATYTFSLLNLNPFLRPLVLGLSAPLPSEQPDWRRMVIWSDWGLYGDKRFGHSIWLYAESVNATGCAGKSAKQGDLGAQSVMTVDNIEAVQLPALNGAGLFEGTNLTLKNCHFHHNQMGIDRRQPTK